MVKIKVETVATVAERIGNRKGLGKPRHIEVNQLWLQDRVRKSEIDVIKIPREDNAADTLTQHRKADEIETHLRLTHQEVSSGRHELMPKLSYKREPDSQQQESDTSMLSVLANIPREDS